MSRPHKTDVTDDGRPAWFDIGFLWWTCRFWMCGCGKYFRSETAANRHYKEATDDQPNE